MSTKTVAKLEKTVIADGKTYRITADTMMGAELRAKDYLAEAIRWNAECTQGKLDRQRHDRAIKNKGIPATVWFPIEAEFTKENQAGVTASLSQWATGTVEDFDEVFATLQEDWDLDPTYILFGVPIYDLSAPAQEALRRLGAKFAARNLTRRLTKRASYEE